MLKAPVAIYRSGEKFAILTLKPQDYISNVGYPSCTLSKMFLPQPYPATVYPGARYIQPKFRPVRPGKVVHLKRCTSFFETFPVGPKRSIAFWTEISGNFG